MNFNLVQKIHSIVLIKSGFYYLIAHNNDMKIPISSALNLKLNFKNSDKIILKTKIMLTIKTTTH